MSKAIKLKRIGTSEYQYKDWNIFDTGIWWMIRNSKNEMELLQHLEKDFNTDEYKDFFKGGRAVLIKIITIDDR